MDEAKNQINDLEHKEAKTTNRKEVKRLQKKQGLCKKPLEQLQAIQHLHHRCRKEKRKSKKLERNPNTNLKEHKHPYVHCSITYNHQDMEAAQVSISR